MKTALGIIVALALVGCSNKYEEENFPVRPKGLQDCEFYRLHNSSGGSIVVARCPNSTTSTTYKSGKSTRSAVVIDGAEQRQEDYFKTILRQIKETAERAEAADQEKPQ